MEKATEIKRLVLPQQNIENEYSIWHDECIDLAKEDLEILSRTDNEIEAYFLRTELVH